MIPLLHIYLKKNQKDQLEKNTCSQTPVFTEALSTIAKILKQPKCSSADQWMKKMWYTGILLSHKQECNFAFAATWMDLKDIMLSEISQ